jgi:HEAT repeat protein
MHFVVSFTTALCFVTVQQVRAETIAATAPLRTANDAAKPIDPKLLGKLAAGLASKDERSAALAALAKLLAEKKDGVTDFGPVLKPLFKLAGWGGEARYNARAAEDLLVRIGSPAVPLLKQRLQSADAHDRRVAVELLVRIGPPNATLVALLRPLLADKDSYVRKAAIEGLGVVGPTAKEAIDDLERVATRDPDLLRRVAARIALIHVAGASHERLRALTDFLEMKETGAEGPKGEKNGPQSPQEAAVFAASALADLEHKARAAERQLLAALKHSNHGIRINAAAALGRIGANSPKTVAALIEVLKNDPEREARRAAASSLGDIGPKAKAALPALSAALKGDGKGGWWVAADALGKIGGTEVVPLLVEALANPDADIRHTSIKALGNLGVVAKPAVMALEKASQHDPRALNRTAAIRALQKIDQAIRNAKRLD